jgi:hypothetical protein
LARSLRFQGLGPCRDLAYAPGISAFVSLQEKRLLHLCSVARSAADLAASGPRVLALPAAQVSSLIAGLVARGLLIDVTAEVSRLSADEERTATGSGIASVGILTKDRPARFQACVDSYLDQARRYGHGIELIVVDDSSEANALQNREALGRVDRTIPVRYIGHRERAEHCKRLVERGVPRPTIEYLLLPSAHAPSYGASRNCLLLDTLGTSILSLDDDTLAIPARHPDWEGGLELTGHSAPCDPAFFRSRVDARAFTRSVDTDIIGEHNALLGRSVAAALAHDANVVISGACGHLGDMVASREFRVMFTQSGKVGDCGRPSPEWVLYSSGSEGERLRTDAAYLRTALESREVADIPRRAAIAHASGCMTTFVGLHNVGLPPFMPYHGNEDGVFSAMLRKVQPRSCAGYLAHGVVHDASPGREYASRFGFHLGDVFGAAIQAFQPASPSLRPEHRLRGLAGWLEQFGVLEPQELGDSVVALMAPAIGMQVQEFTRRAALSSSCADYRRAAAAFADTLASALADSTALVPRDCGTSWNATRAEFGLMAAALHQWPAITEATTQVRGATSERLSRPL